jgi:hypothetical protein
MPQHVLHEAPRPRGDPLGQQGHGIAGPSEQMTGIEPAQPAWEADILPLNYICIDWWGREKDGETLPHLVRHP